MTLFFSLPFKPAGRKNCFLSGHIALALEDIVYQVYNPGLLKAPFLFSIMPVSDWLYGRAPKWVERDPASPNYRHVYLYGRGESFRTVIYCASVSVRSEVSEEIRKRFERDEKRFERGERRYGIIRSNCSSIIADALAEAGLVGRKPSTRVPAFLFKGLVDGRARIGAVSIRKIDRQDTAEFRLHRACAGLWGFDPQGAMDRWLKRRAHEAQVVSAGPFITQLS